MDQPQHKGAMRALLSPELGAVCSAPAALQPPCSHSACGTSASQSCGTGRWTGCSQGPFANLPLILNYRISAKNLFPALSRRILREDQLIPPQKAQGEQGAQQRMRLISGTTRRRFFTEADLTSCCQLSLGLY